MALKRELQYKKILILFLVQCIKIFNKIFEIYYFNITAFIKLVPVNQKISIQK